MAAPTASALSPVVDAVQQNIGGFEPENALDTQAFLAGLQELYTEVGTALINVADRLASEHPVDAAVIDHIREMGGHTMVLANWGAQTHGLFRAAHEAELRRLEEPRPREEDWDVANNR